MIREGIAVGCGLGGVTLGGVCVYGLGGLLWLGLTTAVALLVIGGVLASRPDDN